MSNEKDPVAFEDVFTFGHKEKGVWSWARMTITKHWRRGMLTKQSPCAVTQTNCNGFSQLLSCPLNHFDLFQCPNFSKPNTTGSGSCACLSNPLQPRFAELESTFLKAPKFEALRRLPAKVMQGKNPLKALCELSVFDILTCCPDWGQDSKSAEVQGCLF